MVLGLGRVKLNRISVHNLPPHKEQDYLFIGVTEDSGGNFLLPGGVIYVRIWCVISLVANK